MECLREGIRNECLSRTINCGSDDDFVGRLSPASRDQGHHPDSEHIYSADPAAPQQLLDDEALQLQNERAEGRNLKETKEKMQGARKSWTPSVVE